MIIIFKDYFVIIRGERIGSCQKTKQSHYVLFAFISFYDYSDTGRFANELNLDFWKMIKLKECLEIFWSS